MASQTENKSGYLARFQDNAWQMRYFVSTGLTLEERIAHDSEDALEIHNGEVLGIAANDSEGTGSCAFAFFAMPEHLFLNARRVGKWMVHVQCRGRVSECVPAHFPVLRLCPDCKFVHDDRSCTGDVERRRTAAVMGNENKVVTVLDLLLAETGALIAEHERRVASEGVRVDVFCRVKDLNATDGAPDLLAVISALGERIEAPERDGRHRAFDAERLVLGKTLSADRVELQRGLANDKHLGHPERVGAHEDLLDVLLLRNVRDNQEGARHLPTNHPLLGNFNTELLGLCYPRPAQPPCVLMAHVVVCFWLDM
jgi:hypothetical protein